MRSNMLNKAMNIVDDKNMPVKLQEIRKISDLIYGDYPDKRGALEAQLKAAKEDLSTAETAQEAAEDIEGYDSAAEAVKRAKNRVKFLENAIKKISAEPRMVEVEYNSYVDECREIVENATEDYRNKAIKLMDQLKALKDNYIDLVDNVNETLIKLDQAANVLQTKYTHKVMSYTGIGDVTTLDPNEWEQHAVRFSASDAQRMGTEPKVKMYPYNDHDSVLCAAWDAVSRGYPHRVF